jgi:hypothetical protein
MQTDAVLIQAIKADLSLAQRLAQTLPTFVPALSMLRAASSLASGHSSASSILRLGLWRCSTAKYASKAKCLRERSVTAVHHVCR